jgi:arsenite-transporting ATPase
MRILLFTGKGGVGKTTVAAATAVRCAQEGLRTIVVSTDPAHSLHDAFDVPLGDTPVELAPRLDAQQLDARVRFESAWADIRDYAVEVLGWAGADAVEAEELAVVPGLDEVFALGDLKDHARSGRYDVVVVDCAPTAETLRLLSLPDVLGWYMDKLFDRQRRFTRLARPLVSRLSSMPVAGDSVFAAMRRFYDRLDGVRDLLVDGSVTSARLVMNPQRMVVAEARRTFTYLSLFGYHLDAVVVNKVLPDGLDDPFLAEWRTAQKEQLEVVADSFAPLPVLRGPMSAREVIGIDELGAFADALYQDERAYGRLASIDPLRIEAVPGGTRLSVHLPFSGRHDVDLAQTDDELLVAVGPYRRAVVLPDSLRGRPVRRAAFADGRLQVEFDRSPREAR